MVAAKKDKLSGDCLGTGRRKTAIARVRIRPGSGKVTINGRDLLQYFPVIAQQQAVLDALEVTGKRDGVDCIITCSGGGPNGQAFACKMGIARALLAHDAETFPTLRGRKMYEFMDRLISLALPRVRDFRGISRKAFDGNGSYSMGLSEQLVFPELNPDKFTRVQGMNITFVIRNATDEESREMLTQMGMPFQTEEVKPEKKK